MAIRNGLKSSAWRHRGGMILVAAVAGVMMTACSSAEPEIPETPVEILYGNAKGALEQGEPRKAAKLFDEVERQHPYSKWATQAQLMSAYSYYLVDAYDDAIPALERFIELHPGNRSASYAFYLRALCFYEQIEDVKRDQENTELAQRALSDVIARFPNTPYARDATVKLDLVRDHLAGKEMDVGRYYLKRNQYLAAINRFKVVVDRFQTTTHVPEALERLTEAYVALGVFAEAQKATSVLGYNYPGSPWYTDAYSLLVSRGLTAEGIEADAPIALVDPTALKGQPADAAPAAEEAVPSDIAPAPPAVPVDPVITTTEQAPPDAPVPTSSGGDASPPPLLPPLSSGGTELSTNSSLGTGEDGASSEGSLLPPDQNPPLQP